MTTKKVPEYSPWITVVSHCCLWAPFTCISWINVNNLFIPTWFSWRAIYLAITVVLICIAIACISRKGLSDSKKELPRPEILDWTCSIVLSLSCVLVISPNLFGGSEYLAIAGTLLGGACIGWMYARWGLLYSRLHIKYSLKYIFISSIIWLLIFRPLVMIPGIFGLLLAMALPFISCIALRFALAHPPEIVHATQYRQPTSLVTMWKTWLVIVTVGLIISMLVVMSTGSTLVIESFLEVDLPRTLISVALCGVVLVWSYKTNLAFNFVTLWRIMIYILACALLFVIIAPNDFFTILFSYSSWNILVPIVWVTTVDIARHSNISPYVPIGIGLSAYSLPYFLGTPLYEMISPIFGNQVIFTVALFILLFVLGTCLETRDPDTQRIFEDLRGKSPMPADFSSIDARCKKAGTEHALTEREIEVMQMVCKGMSRTYIAETLFISENTVKAHVSHLYEKMSVHSKRELQELVGI